MRRLRDRYREQASDDLPDQASAEAGPDTMAGQSELAKLVTGAAGGLSDRDRTVLDLTYRHGRCPYLAGVPAAVVLPK